ncbi:MAG: cytochrome c biogenesis protein ResB, partial [Deltaproteobacteria bacterium]|nr:cytochrome c biogenesis protein ResB [Deltaproteobacteria bacterium]
YTFLKAAGFVDLYGCWWFRFTLGLFTLNLICCTISRLPRVKHLLFHGNRVLDEQMLKTIALVKKCTVKGDASQVEQALGAKIGAFLGTPTLVKDAGGWNFFAEKGRISILGPTITHVGLVLIIAGALAGDLGYQGYMQIFEGETTDVVILSDQKATQKLDFAIRCDKFDVTFYEGSQRPKDYISALTVIEGGKDVLRKVIEVNDPLIYNGIYFYQSSYGSDQRGGGELVVQVIKNGAPAGKPRPVLVGKSFQLEDSEDVVWADRFLSDFSMNDQGSPFSRSDQLRNPAAYLRVVRDGKDVQAGWVFAKFPDYHKKKLDYDFRLVDFTPRQYTGLQVTYDPGVFVVWLGCLLLTVGIYIAFFTSHRRIWLKVEQKDGAYTATLAGTSNKNRVVFKRDFENLFKDLKS